MKILSLHIDGFGKFHNRDISFQDGLNVVYGKNEAGKSTLHTFIKGSTGSSAVSRKVTSAFVSLMKLLEKKRRITRLYGTSCAAACLKLLMIIPLALDC